MRRKRFEDCKNKHTLPFDFYIPKNNTCIEYDGEQHFRPINFANKDEEWANQQFEKTKQNDKIKNDYCNKKGIKLIRIPYYENIETQLNNFLFI